MKTTITKKELKKIYDVACADWKPKIKKYAGENPFEDEISFSEKQIEEMVSASTKEQLPIVKQVFNIQDSWRDITSVEDAIKYLGESDEEVIALQQLKGIKNLARHIVAGQELVVITKAINEKKELDWNNSNQAKYCLWWYLGDNFRLYGVYVFYSTSNCSAHLCFIDRERAEHASVTFKKLYEEYMNK